MNRYRRWCRVVERRCPSLDSLPSGSFPGLVSTESPSRLAGLRPDLPLIPYRSATRLLSLPADRLAHRYARRSAVSPWPRSRSARCSSVPAPWRLPSVQPLPETQAFSSSFPFSGCLRGSLNSAEERLPKLIRSRSQSQLPDSFRYLFRACSSPNGSLQFHAGQFMPSLCTWFWCPISALLWQKWVC